MPEKLNVTPADIAPRVAPLRKSSEPESKDRDSNMVVDLEGKRFRSLNGDLVIAPTGETDDEGRLIVEQEVGDDVEETHISPETLNRYYVPIDDTTEQLDIHPEQAPKPLLSRDTLKSFIEPISSENLPFGERRYSLGELEKEILLGLPNDKSIDDLVAPMKKVVGENDQLDAVKTYLDRLRSATEKKQAGEDAPEVAEITEYLKATISEKRDKYAEQEFRRINSPAGLNTLRLPKNKRKLELAEAEYDESLSLFGRWMSIGETDKQKRREQAGELAVEEYVSLHDTIDQLRASGQPQGDNWLDKVRNTASKMSQKEFIRFKKVRLTLGDVAVAATSGAVGFGVKAAFGGAGIVAGAAAGAVAGGVAGGLRASKEKSGLSEVSDAEKADLRSRVTTGNVDQILRSYRHDKIRETTNERRKKLAIGIGKSAARGMLAGAIGGGAADLIGVGVDWIGDNASAKSAAGAAFADIPGIEPSPEPGEAPTEVPLETETGQEVPVETPESTPPTTEELLQEHAGDTAEAATTIEAGEGPYQTFNELGIPKDQWSELLSNEGLVDKLVENGDAYRLDGGGFGLSHAGELSNASIQDIYEAAKMDAIDTVEVPTVDTPLYDDLPESYSELPENIQEFAHGHSILTNIPSGMGGEQLMYELGADPSAWYKFEDQLLSVAPNDFYRMPDGHVGLSHPGALSADGLRAIAAEISKQGYALAA